MARECEYCGKKTTFGMSFARRGLAKKVGGVGKRITGHDSRTFKPNVQRVRAVVNGSVKRVKACAKCLRSGKVQKPGPGRGKNPS
jgi:large subunit ribosomal protein L28